MDQIKTERKKKHEQFMYCVVCILKILINNVRNYTGTQIREIEKFWDEIFLFNHPHVAYQPANLRKINLKLQKSSNI